MTGPRAAEGGYDYMMQGLAGWMSLTGDPDGPPTKSGLSLVDLSGGYASAIAVLAGLWRARRDGVGCDCDVSLFDTALHELMYVGTWAASRGYVPPRRRNSAHPSIVPFQNFPTADGWIVVACPKEKFWRLLCDAIGRPELARRSSRPSPTATGAATSWSRSSRRSSATRTSDEWLAVLAAAGVPSAPVNDVEAALEEARLVEYEHPRARDGAAGRLAAAAVRRGAAGAAGAGARRAHGAGAGRAVRLRARAGARARGRGVFGVRRKELQMPKTSAIQPEGLATPKPPYSPVVVSGDTVYTAGQIANGPDGNLVEGGIERADAAGARERPHVPRGGGLTMDDVVKVNAYLADLGGLPGLQRGLRRVLRRAVPGADVGAGAGCRPGVLVEIEAVARRAS